MFNAGGGGIFVTVFVRTLRELDILVYGGHILLRNIYCCVIVSWDSLLEVLKVYTGQSMN